MLKATLLLAGLISSSAQAASFDGLWEGRPLYGEESWDADGHPKRILPYRVRIDGDVVHIYFQESGKFVEGKSQPRLMRAEDSAFLYYPHTRQAPLISGFKIEQKNKDALIVHVAEAAEDGTPTGKVTTTLPDWTRVQD